MVRSTLKYVWLCMVVAAAMLFACGGDSGSGGGGGSTDAGGGSDASKVVDAGSKVVDSGTTTDAGKAASCSDGVKNQDETDVDCGGSTCQKCANGKACKAAADCMSGDCEGTTCTAPPAAPVITSFTAAKSTVTKGQSTTLTGVFTGGTGAIDNGVGAVTSNVAISTGVLNATTTFTITVTNAKNVTATQIVKVTVVDAPAITSFTASPAYLPPAGGTTTLTGVFTGGTGSVDNGVGAVTTGVGATSGNITADTTFTLTVTNAAGDKATKTASVSVGLLHYWAGNDDTKDSFGGVDGAMAGAFTYAAAKVNDGFSFNGAPGYVDIPSTAAISGTGDFSLEAWVSTSTTTSQVILQQRGGAYEGELIFGLNWTFLTENANDGAVCYWDYNDAQGGIGLHFCGATNIADGKLHHVAFVRKGTTGTIYVDGAVDGTQDAGITIDLQVIELAIGADRRDNTRYFNGLVDEVKTWGVPLTAAQVLSHAK